MITRAYHWILLIAVCLVSGPGLHAQTATGDKPKPTFRIVSVVGSYGELHYRINAKEPDRIITVNRALSAPLPAPSGLLEIYRLVPPPADSPVDTPPTRQVVIKADLNSNIPESIVVVLPLTPTDQKTLFETRVISPDRDFEAGTCLIANFSSFDQAAVSIKKDIHTVGMGKIDIVNFTDGHNLIKAAVEKGGKWAVACDDAWRLSSQYRGYILIFPYIPDPDYPPPPIAPPVIVRINFEFAPVPPAK